MNKDHEPFIRTICEHPLDDAPRLIYADWLDEQGECARAEFIRVQCELAIMIIPGDVKKVSVEAQYRFCDLQQRELNLLASASCGYPEHTQRGCKWEQLPGGIRWLWKFRRGMIEILNATFNDWVEHAAAILRWNPIREVELTTWPHYSPELIERFNEVTREQIIPGGFISDIQRHTANLFFGHFWPDIEFKLPPPVTIAMDWNEYTLENLGLTAQS